MFLGSNNNYLQLTQPEPSIPSMRFVNNNIYRIDGKFSMLAPINSTPPPKKYQLEDWRIQWTATNGGESNSTIIPNSFLYDTSTNILTLDISSIPTYSQLYQVISATPNKYVSTMRKRVLEIII